MSWRHHAGFVGRFPGVNPHAWAEILAGNFYGLVAPPGWRNAACAAVQYQGGCHKLAAILASSGRSVMRVLDPESHRAMARLDLCGRNASWRRSLEFLLD